MFLPPSRLAQSDSHWWAVAPPATLELERDAIESPGCKIAKLPHAMAITFQEDTGLIAKRIEDPDPSAKRWAWAEMVLISLTLPTDASELTMRMDAWGWSVGHLHAISEYAIYQ